MNKHYILKGNQSLTLIQKISLYYIALVVIYLSQSEGEGFVIAMANTY